MSIRAKKEIGGCRGGDPLARQRGAAVIEYSLILAVFVLAGVQMAGWMLDRASEDQTTTAAEIGREQVWLPDTTTTTTSIPPSSSTNTTTAETTTTVATTSGGGDGGTGSTTTSTIATTTTTLPFAGNG